MREIWGERQIAVSQSGARLFTMKLESCSAVLVVN
jgi:hypothetical protein